MSGKTDTRIVYGALCIWWDSIHKATRNAVGLPCCPHCSGVLMEVPDEKTWWDPIKEHAKKENKPEYVDLWKWMQGRCFKTFKDAEQAYAQR